MGFFIFFSSWRIGLQYYVGFSLTAMQISHNYIYIYPLRLELPSPPTPLGHSRMPGLPMLYISVTKNLPTNAVQGQMASQVNSIKLSEKN